MSDKLREALRRIVGIRGVCFEGRPMCHAIDQFDLIHNLAVKALADSAKDICPTCGEEYGTDGGRCCSDTFHCGTLWHHCKYCPDEDAHPDGFCICKRCGTRMGLSPAREAKRRETLKRIDGMLYVQETDDATADTPTEPTEEMVEAAEQAEELLAEVVRCHKDELLPRMNFWRECSASAYRLRAALAVQQKRALGANQ